MSKPFFYRLNASDLFAVVRELSDKECSKWLRIFASDLVAGNTQNEFTQSLIDEAKKYKENKSLAGKKGMEKRYQNPNTVITELQQMDNIDITRSSNSNNTEPKDIIPYGEIIDDLNVKGGFRYRIGEATKKHIRGRFAEGYTLEDFLHVHTVKVAQWKGTKDEMYLRPSTLYNSEKFEGYANTKSIKMKRIIGLDGMWAEVPE